MSFETVTTWPISTWPIGTIVPAGALFGGLSEEALVLRLVEKVDGVPFFDASYLGINVGQVKFNNDSNTWGWSE